MLYALCSTLRPKGAMQQIFDRIKELADRPGYPDRADRLQQILDDIEAEVSRLIHQENIKKYCRVNNDEVIRRGGL